MVTVKVDKGKCIGCGLCASLCPEVFELGSDGKAYVKNPNACKNGTCKEATESCPTDAITFKR